MLGHVLYLKRRPPIRATGIGCFFDDEMHKLLESGIMRGKACTTSPWAVRWTIRGFRRCRRMNSSRE